MKFITTKTYEDLSNKAADLITAQILIKSNCVLGLATGSSPIGTYKRLIEDNKNGKVDFSRVTTVNLDEYVGIDISNNQSYRYFMNENLFNHINIDKAKTFVPNGCAKDLKAEGASYDQMIKDLGGIDLQLLGVGLNGHIGFNEPDRFFTAATHEVILDESTIKANSRFFVNEDEVPKTAITMGMKGIMQARKLLLIANGTSKMKIIEKAFCGPIDPQVPASILQLHPDVTVILSEN